MVADWLTGMSDLSLDQSDININNNNKTLQGTHSKCDIKNNKLSQLDCILWSTDILCQWPKP